MTHIGFVVRAGKLKLSVVLLQPEINVHFAALAVRVFEDVAGVIPGMGYK